MILYDKPVTGPLNGRREEKSSRQNKTALDSNEKERPFERESIRLSKSSRTAVSKQHVEQNVKDSPLVKKQASKSNSATIDLTRNQSSSKVSVNNCSIFAYLVLYVLYNFCKCTI